MNNFSKVQDLLLHNQHLHGRIAEFYSALAAEANSEEVKMLLNVLVKHEIELMTTLREYIDKASAKVLDTYYQFDREKSIDHLFTIRFTQAQLTEGLPLSASQSLISRSFN